jgi:hypothetical protein
MTSTLLRACLGCGKQVRGKPRCADCQRYEERAKAARRPERKSYSETERRRLLADHRARVGDWCPGLGQHPAHPCADLVADHLVEVSTGGLESGPLRVLCRSENSRRSAWLATGLRPLVAATLTPPRQPKFPTHTGSLDDGPVVA